MDGEERELGCAGNSHIKFGFRIPKFWYNFSNERSEPTERNQFRNLEVIFGLYFGFTLIFEPGISNSLQATIL